MHAIHRPRLADFVGSPRCFAIDRRPLVAALGALALTGATAAAAAALSEIDLRGGDEAATTAPVTLPTPPAPSTQPAWVTEPMAPPALMR